MSDPLNSLIPPPQLEEENKTVPSVITSEVPEAPSPEIPTGLDIYDQNGEELSLMFDRVKAAELDALEQNDDERVARMAGRLNLEDWAKPFKHPSNINDVPLAMGLENPDFYKKEELAVRFLVDRSGFTSREVKGNLQKFMNHYGEEHLGLAEGDDIDVEQFYDSVGKHIENKGVQHDMVMTASADVFKGLTEGKGWNEIWPELVQKYSALPGWDESMVDTYRMMHETNYTLWKSNVDVNEALIVTLEKYFKDNSRGEGNIKSTSDLGFALGGSLGSEGNFVNRSTAPQQKRKKEHKLRLERDDAMFEALASLPDPMTREIIIAAAAERAKLDPAEEDARGDSFGMDPAIAMARGTTADAKGSMKAVKDYYKRLFGRFHGEDTKDKWERRKFQESVRHDVLLALEGKVDPVRHRNIVEEGINGFAGSFHYMVGLAVPWVGLPVIALAVKEQTRLSLQDTGEFTEDQVDFLADFSTPIIVGIELAQKKLFWGRVGGKKAATFAREQAVSRLAKIFKMGAGHTLVFGKNFVGQLAEETAQEFTTEGVQWATKLLGRELPGVDWGKAATEYKENFRGLAATLFIFAGVGTGNAHINDMASMRQFVGDGVGLKALGLKDEMIADIKKSYSSGVMEAKFKKYYPLREVGTHEQIRAAQTIRERDIQAGKDISPEQFVENRNPDTGEVTYTVTAADGKELGTFGNGAYAAFILRNSEGGLEKLSQKFNRNQQFRLLNQGKTDTEGLTEDEKKSKLKFFSDTKTQLIETSAVEAGFPTKDVEDGNGETHKELDFDNMFLEDLQALALVGHTKAGRLANAKLKKQGLPPVNYKKQAADAVKDLDPIHLPDLSDSLEAFTEQRAAILKSRSAPQAKFESDLKKAESLGTVDITPEGLVENIDDITVHSGLPVPKLTAKQKEALSIKAESLHEKFLKIRTLVVRPHKLDAFTTSEWGMKAMRLVNKHITLSNVYFGRANTLFEKATLELKHKDKVWMRKHFKDRYEKSGHHNMPDSANKENPEAIRDFAKAWKEITKIFAEAAERFDVWIDDPDAPGGRRKFDKNNVPLFYPHQKTKIIEDALRAKEGIVYRAIIKALARNKGMGVDEFLGSQGVWTEGRKFGPLEEKRGEAWPDTITTEEGNVIEVYEKDPFVDIEKYINQASQRMAMIETFAGFHPGTDDLGNDPGAKHVQNEWENGQVLAPIISEEIYWGLMSEKKFAEAKVWKALWENINGEIGRRGQKSLEALGIATFFNTTESFARLMQLSMSAIPQLTMGWVPIATRGGIGPTMKKFLAVTVNKMKENPRTQAELYATALAGSHAHFVMGQTYETEDFTGKAETAARLGLTAVGFSWSNRVLNQVGSLVAMENFTNGIAALREERGDEPWIKKYWGMDQESIRRMMKKNFSFTDADIDRMVNNGMDYTDFAGLRQKFLNDPDMQTAYLDLAQALQRFTGRTNLWREPISDRPPWMSEVTARKFMAYMSMTRIMGNVMSDAYNEARHKNLQPLVTLLVGGSAGGGATVWLRDILYDRDHEPIEDAFGFLKTLINWQLEAGIWGLAGSELESAFWGAKMSGNFTLHVPLMEWWAKNILGLGVSIWNRDFSYFHKSLAKTTPLYRAVDAHVIPEPRGKSVDELINDFKNAQQISSSSGTLINKKEIKKLLEAQEKARAKNK